MRTGALLSFSPPSSPDDIIDVDEVRCNSVVVALLLAVGGNHPHVVHIDFPHEG